MIISRFDLQSEAAMTFDIKIRRILTFFDEVREQNGHAVEPVLCKSAAAAIVENPFAGRYVDDLSPLVTASEAIGREICAIAVGLLAPHAPVSYGKAAIIGLSGEQEHGNAMLTTVFGNVMREVAGGGKAWISSLTKRAAPGASIDIPLAHKDALYVRSHYDGITIALSDAPLPDEIAVICAYATRGRPNSRVGGLAAGEIKGIDGLT
ncbi:MAG: amino acid synthesis family protein [Bradyrhizobium sp.]